MSAAKKWAIPPGYRVLDHIVQEHGRDHTETKLLSGEWPAFRLDLVTGDLYPIPITTWGVYRGHNWLEKGASGRMVLRRSAAVFGVAYYAVIVRVSEQPPSRMNNPKDLDGPKVRKARMALDESQPSREGPRTGSEGAEHAGSEARHRRPCHGAAPA
jgi:hypothetical protein